MKPVLICGGVGKKMWPLSRKKLPKHFLPLINGKSLYQINYEALRKKFKPEEIYIQTTRAQAKTALEQAPGVPHKNCFIEPELRDTGPAMGFMAVKLFALDPDEPFTLVQVDVLRKPSNAYLKMIDQIESLVKKEGKLITGGIRLDYPAMGVDYLKIIEGKSKKLGGIEFHKVEKYIDRKVGRKSIEKLFKQKLILTHANHNSLTPRLFLELYKKHAPDWHRHLKKMVNALGKSNEERVIKEEFTKMKPDRTERVTKFAFDDGYVAELPFEWTDFGTWESVSDYEKDNKTYKPENLLEINSKNCYVRKGDKKFVALIGTKDLAIIDTQDALLVCKIDQAAKVKEVIAYLKKTGRDEYL